MISSLRAGLAPIFSLGPIFVLQVNFGDFGRLPVRARIGPGKKFDDSGRNEAKKVNGSEAELAESASEIGLWPSGIGNEEF